MTTIDHFSGDHDFLSNFHPSPIEIDGVLYPTVEHAFQAAKTFDATEKQSVAEAATPGSAKRLGRKVQLRPDWEQVKIGIMEGLVRLKFTTHVDLRAKLLASFSTLRNGCKLDRCVPFPARSSPAG